MICLPILRKRALYSSTTTSHSGTPPRPCHQSPSLSLFLYRWGEKSPFLLFISHLFFFFSLENKHKKAQNCVFQKLVRYDFHDFPFFIFSFSVWDFFFFFIFLLIWNVGFL